MRDRQTLMFAPFRLDLGNEQLWRGQAECRLTRKAFAVLRCMVEHAGQLVTKDDLFAAIWPETYVSDAALVVCIREIRQALGDHRQASRFLETVYGRGYRFIAPVSTAPRLSDPLQTPRLVGRATELNQLRQWFNTALQGTRQVGFVTGEAGIGKTTLVETFLAQIETNATLWIGRGQCIDQYGAGEPYLPILDALGRLCRGENGPHLIGILSRQAPSWLAQMPALLSPTDLDTLQSGGGVTQARMLRELAEAVETLAAERPLVLVLEDLHWSDTSTLAWLASVARRPEAARLLIIVTYRPADVLARSHPVRTVQVELQQHGQCDELVLSYWSEAAVAAYLEQRFPDRSLPEDLVRWLHQRTEGHPLFLVTLVDTMVEQGALPTADEPWTWHGPLADAVAIPESLWQLIDQQLRQLCAEDYTLLEVASVAGVAFSVPAVSAGADVPEDEVEQRCAALARRQQFIRPSGTTEWPDGAVATRYNFRHTLYQEVLYERLPAGQRAHLHRRIGLRLEAGHGERSTEIAAELAVHFQCGRDDQRTLRYLWHAGRNALQRSAHQEAITHLTNGLERLRERPETLKRTQQELTFQATLGTSLIAIKGWAALEVEHAYARAYDLWRQVGETQQFCWVLAGLCAFHSVRAEWQTAREQAERLLSLAQLADDSTLRLHAHLGLGGILYGMGAFVAAREHVEHGLALYDPATHNPYISDAVHDPAVMGLCHAAAILWHLGYPDQARLRLHEALAQAHALAHPFSLAQTLYFAALFFQSRRELQHAQAYADALIGLATEQGFSFLEAGGLICRGLVMTQQGQSEAGIEQLHQGLTAYQATGAQAGRPYILAGLAQAHGQAGRVDRGLHLINEALVAVETTGERLYEAGLYRLKGELLSQSRDHHPEAETCFHDALTVARHQQAKSLELRAAISLGRLWQPHGKQDEALKVLAPIYNGFTEGFDTADLQEAKALLEKLGS